MFDNSFPSDRWNFGGILLDFCILLHFVCILFRQYYIDCLNPDDIDCMVHCILTQ